MSALPRFTQGLSISSSPSATPQFRALSLGAGVPSSAAAIRTGNARANASGNALLGEAFLHRSRVPLGRPPIDHVTTAELAALGETPASELEDGGVDDCSPWSRRSEVNVVQDDFGLTA
ncbi:hypothetical protein ACIGW7_18945 [Streptomyces sp. NPDC053253]|uniref:hypothetical protein n=1 Tax=Streptomyces sp. NPDC053253 TaxID=3365699 RepID=UPI0037D7A05F